MSFINNDSPSTSDKNNIITTTDQQKSASSQELSLSSTIQKKEEVSQEVEECESNYNMIHIHPTNKDYIPTTSLFYHQSITVPSTTTKVTPPSLQKQIITQLHDTMQSYIYPTWIKKTEEKQDSSLT